MFACLSVHVRMYALGRQVGYAVEQFFKWVVDIVGEWRKI